MRPKSGFFDARDCDKYTFPVKHGNNLLNSFPFAPVIFPNDNITTVHCVYYIMKQNTCDAVALILQSQNTSLVFQIILL